MNAASPTVSACLLTYRRADVLPRTIEDILAQTYTDFELVINDDRSPDQTESVCRTFVERDSRVLYFRNNRNLRYAGNQNAAISRARGRYVAFIHDGDRYSPQLLERWVDAMERHPSAALVFNSVGILDRFGIVTHAFDHGFRPLTPGRAMYDTMLQGLSSPIFGIVMARRAALVEAGGFDESLPFLADVDMWFRLLAGHDVAYVPERLYSIYPRETDHPNASVNWAIRDELARIYRTACDRRWRRGSRAWRRARSRVDMNLAVSDFRSILSAVRRRNWSPAVRGLLPWVSRMHNACLAQCTFSMDAT